MRWIWVLSIVGCAAEERSKPEPPDMSALIAAYATPTATFDGQGATEVQQLVESKVRTLLDFDVIVDRLQQTIAALGEDAGAAFAPGRPLALEGEGVATVQRICSGFGDPVPPVDKDANGFLSLTAGYSDNGLDPVVFGGATACQEQVSGVQMQVAGDVHLYVGEGTGVTDLASTTFLFELANFAFEVDGTTEISGGFDFEVCRGETTACVPGHVGVLLTLASGTTLVVFVDLNTKTGGFRAADGVWTCDFGNGECTSETGAKVAFTGYQL